MPLKKISFLIIYLFTGMTIWSCKKDHSNTSITSNNWKVEKLSKKGEITYLQAPNSYILRFINDTSYSLNLDVNTCQGTYKITTHKNIEFSAAGCTKICCDSDFASDLLLTLPEITDYYVEGKELILTGKKGTILFKKQ